MKNLFFKTQIKGLLCTGLFLLFALSIWANDGLTPYELQGKDRVVVISKKLHKSEIKPIVDAFAETGAILSFEKMEYTSEGYFKYGVVKISSAESKGEITFNRNDPTSLFPKMIYTTRSGAIGLGVFEAAELQKAKVQISEELMAYYTAQFPLILLNGKKSSKQEIDAVFKNCNDPKCMEAIQNIEMLQAAESKKRFGVSSPNGTISIKL